MKSGDGPQIIIPGVQSLRPPCSHPFDLCQRNFWAHSGGNPRAMVRGIRRTLAPDGVYLAQDINGSSHVHENCDHPIGALLYTISCMHCMTVSLAQEGGEGLGAMWGRQKAVEIFSEAGFGSVEVNDLAHDIQNCYYVCRP